MELPDSFWDTLDKVSSGYIWCDCPKESHRRWYQDYVKVAIMAPFASMSDEQRTIDHLNKCFRPPTGIMLIRSKWSEADIRVLMFGTAKTTMSSGVSCLGPCKGLGTKSTLDNLLVKEPKLKQVFDKIKLPTMAVSNMESGLLVHEFGHAFGLSHNFARYPGSTNIHSGGGLPQTDERCEYSMMNYPEAWDRSVKGWQQLFPATAPTACDIKQLSHLYRDRAHRLYILPHVRTTIEIDNGSQPSLDSGGVHFTFDLSAYDRPVRIIRKVYAVDYKPVVRPKFITGTYIDSYEQVFKGFEVLTEEASKEYSVTLRNRESIVIQGMEHGWNPSALYSDLTILALANSNKVHALHNMAENLM